MAKKKSHKSFKSLSTRSDSHSAKPPSKTQKNKPIEESTVGRDTNEMEGIEGPPAKRRALGTGKLNARSFEYRDLQDRTRRKAECPSNPGKKGQSMCIRGKVQDRDVAPNCGGFRHRFQVRIRDLSPVEDDPESKDDDPHSSQNDNHLVTVKTKATWMSQEEANAAVFCLGPLDAMPGAFIDISPEELERLSDEEAKQESED
ncbi:hypothetical protein J7337_010358 [Fusarium musae]|uniref:Uncharacterized protein n=1 Tax=Fusarium musae TaxID=1042133 RepID=A0A9P8IL49_9HYPO|nr:hypothetical protein J7337_010358 [Fusarium musae]KAG9497497.1 hypothetical protein J7337_010358 [Fusarium musae]